MRSGRFVLFDLDGTLLDRTRLFERWALAFLQAESLDPAELQWLVEEDRDGLNPKDEFFVAVRERYGLTAPVSALVERYHLDYPTFAEPVPSATAGALKRLRVSGWALGIVTNGPPLQAQVVEIAGLRPLVDSVCVSSVVGLRKPDPAIFRLAAEGLGGTMAGSWMVGDSPTHDIAGAAAAGLNTVWIARDREWQETDYRPTLVATSVAEAVEKIESGVS